MLTTISLSRENVLRARFDDTNVQQFHYTNYGSPTEPEKHQYPEDVVIKYPKSGTTNPTVSLFVMELADQSAIEVTPPGEVTAFGEYLYTAAKWIKEGEWDFIFDASFIVVPV